MEVLEVTYYKELPLDPDVGFQPLEELFKTTSRSGFVPRVGDQVRWKEQMWPVLKFAYFPARLGRGVIDGEIVDGAKYYPERASIVLGKPDGLF